MPVAHGSRPRHAPAPVVSYAAVAAAASDGGDIMFSGTGDEIEDVIRIVQSAR